DLTNLPSPLVLTFDFGAGCVVQDGSAAPPTLGGTAVLTATNLVIGETSVSGSVEIVLNNITVNGLPVASGSVAATFNLNLAPVGDTIVFTGPVSVALTGLRLPNNIGFDGMINILFDPTGVATISTNLLSSPIGLPIMLNGVTVAPQLGGGVLV